MPCTVDTTFTPGFGSILQTWAPIACSLSYLLLAIRNIAIAAGILLTIVAGIKYATSKGDPEKAASAKSTITWAIVAIVFAVALWAIIRILFIDIFGLEGIERDYKIPFFYEDPPPITH